MALKWIEGFSWAGISPIAGLPAASQLQYFLTRYNAVQSGGGKNLGNFGVPTGRFPPSNSLNAGGSFDIQQLNPGLLSSSGRCVMGLAATNNIWNFETLGAGGGDLFGFGDTTGAPGSDMYILVGTKNGKLALYGPPVSTGAVNPGVLLATGTTVLLNSSYYYIELEVTIGIAGHANVYLDGNLEISLATNTLHGLSGNVDRLFLCCPAAPCVAQFCDLYVDDNNVLGPRRVITGFPSADGAILQWTPSAGLTQFNLVNIQPPPGDASYIFDSNAGDISLFQFPVLPYTPQSIAGVQASAYLRKDDLAARTAALVCRSAGSNFPGSSTPGLTTSYVDYRQLYVTDPATGLAWTPAGLNAAQFGVKLLS